MQPDAYITDAELIELAQETDRVAQLVDDPGIQFRLRQIAQEVLALVRVHSI